MSQSSEGYWTKQASPWATPRCVCPKTCFLAPSLKSNTDLGPARSVCYLGDFGNLTEGSHPFLSLKSLSHPETPRPCRAGQGDADLAVKGTEMVNTGSLYALSSLTRPRPSHHHPVRRETKRQGSTPPSVDQASKHQDSAPTVASSELNCYSHFILLFN